MESADDEDCVILGHDDEAEDPLESSVLLVEPSEDFPLEGKETGEVVDEECEVIVTFCKRAKLMPHARYDCTDTPFERAECETSHPLGRNAETCGECFCYICSKRAVECTDWVTPSLCHCNAHNKSKYWKGQWNFAATGGLATFNLDLSEIDGDIQRGGVLLQKFTHDLSVEYNKYLSGERVSSDGQKCLCHRNLGPGQCDMCGLLHQYVTYRYSPVSDLVTDFLNQAEREKPKAEVIVLLGAAREVLLHKHPTPYSQNVDLSATLAKPVTNLVDRITRRLQRLLVLNDFPKPLYNKLVHFYRAIPFPTYCYYFRSSLDFMTWDHGLLTCVLKGQNVTGQRTQKGKKQSICEMIPVMEARIERMENRQQYREMVRYLKVVKCSDLQWLQQQRDKLPFYLCKCGDIRAASQALFSFFSKSCCAACRLSPSQFKVFLKIFRTGHVPSGKELEDSAQWSAVALLKMATGSDTLSFPVAILRGTLEENRGGPLKFPLLMKKMLRVVYCNLSLYKNPQCWSSLIRAFSSHSFLGEDGRLIPLTLKEPPPDFQQIVFRKSGFIVDELRNKLRTNVFLSEVFSLDTHLEAGLIFLVQALLQMVVQEYSSLPSFLEIVLAFGRNIWALKLLLESLAFHEKALRTIVGLTITDLHTQKAEMLALWHRFGPWYVCDLLYLFLSSKDRNVPSIGIIIVNIIKENLHKCLWAKQVGEFLQNARRQFAWVSPDVSSFIAASQALP